MAKLNEIDFDKYIFDIEKGIWSKHYKKWIKGYVRTYKDGQKRRMIKLLNKKGEKKDYLYYRVLAYLFIPIPSIFANIAYEDLEIDHINGDSTDDRIENLRWTDRSGNMNNPITKERNKKAQKMMPVEQWSKDGKVLIKVYISSNEAARQNNLNQGNIYNCCNGNCKSTGGFIWKFAS